MKKTDQEAKWFSRLRTSPIGLSITAVVAILIGAAAATDSTDKLLIWSGLKPDALQLVENNSRGQFSRDLTRAAWRRLFLMRRLVLAAKSGFPEQEKDEIWTSYIKALEDWNSDLMFNILSLERYYGRAKRDEFEGSIQPSFGQIHYCLEALRHPEGKVKCTLSSDRNIQAIEDAINRLNSSLYLFVSGLPDKEDARAKDAVE